VTSGGLGDAQIKGLVDRLNTLVAGGGQTRIALGQFTANTNGWSQLSAIGVLPGGSPAGTELLIETDGFGNWASATNGITGNLSFAARGGLPPNQFAEAKYSSAIFGNNPGLNFSFHARVTITVESPGVAICHTSAGVAPMLPNVATGPDQAGVAEGHTVGVNFSPNVGVPWHIGAAWQQSPGSMGIRRTRITLIGGG
jgi:hypothetical protein